MKQDKENKGWHSLPILPVVVILIILAVLVGMAKVIIWAIQYWR